MRKTAAVFLMILIALGFCACGGQKVPASSEVKKEARQVVDAFGIVKALEIKDIVIDFPCFIEKINVKEGQKISKGDLLVTLNIDEYQSSIRDKELSLKSVQNEVSKIRSNYIESDNSPELQKYLNDLKNAENLYNKDLKEYEDKMVLLNSGSLSRSELDEFKKTVDARKKDIDDIKFSIGAVKYNKQRELDPKETTALSLQENLQLMKSKLTKSYMNKNQIVSEVDNGVVYAIGYVQGEKVDVSKKLLSILDYNSLAVQADVAEDFIKDVKLGAEVVIIPQADKSKEYKGKVTRISWKAIQKNGETDIPVEISLENKDDFLIADMNVDVKIQIIK